MVRLRKSKARLEHRIDSYEEKITKLEDELFNIRDKTRDIQKMEKEKQQLEEELTRAQEKVKNQESVISSLEKSSNLINSKEFQLKDISVGRTGVEGQYQDDLNKAYFLYDTAKAQMVKFSELLMKKEIELETAKNKITGKT